MSAVSKTKEAESVIASLRELGSLRSEGIISDSEFDKLKAELISGAEERGVAEPSNRDTGGEISGFAADMFRTDDAPQQEASAENDILSGIDFSLDDDIKPRESVKAVGAPQPPDAAENDILSGIDFSLDDIQSAPEPVIPDKKSMRSSEYSVDLTEGIDFDLNSSPQKRSRPYKKNGAVKSASERLKEIGRYFSAVKDKYNERDCALMDKESLESLSILPIFIMGIAAAFFFYYVLKIFGEMDAGAKEILILLCFCAGVLPACVIIPNTVKTERRSRCAREADEELKKYYIRSGCTDIPYEYSNPYIIEELRSLIDDGRADSISSAVAQLDKELSSEGVLTAEKKQADFSDNDEIAFRSAALYVLGRHLEA